MMAGKCRIINQWKDKDGKWYGDGMPCQEPATYEVRGLNGKVIGKCCSKHGKETEQLIQAANGFVSGISNKN